MRFLAGLLLIALIAVGVAYAFGLIRVEQTRDASLPSVAVKPGTLPAYKADVVKVDVGTRNETVEVPTIDVKKPE
ncbi:hypothetical protein PX699_02975 [Sphingobium sp. H39-3-25]|uniref:hypothetical protein n=1 Tax=Sphingobium arseniciresistens TaxID=3030834 RepID=UPI0023B921B5|nr:hypothetical protein [Sphingobium arseniciresistens]